MQNDFAYKMDFSSTLGVKEIKGLTVYSALRHCGCSLYFSTNPDSPFRRFCFKNGVLISSQLLNHPMFSVGTFNLNKQPQRGFLYFSVIMNR